MPIPVTNLKPGDRVILNCPKARGQTHREAEFDGIFNSVQDAMEDASVRMDALLVGPSTLTFLSTGGKAFARFLLQTTRGAGAVLEYPGGGVVRNIPDFGGETRLMAVFVIEPDGGLREEDGRRIFIERRVTAGKG